MLCVPVGNAVVRTTAHSRVGVSVLHRALIFSIGIVACGCGWNRTNGSFPSTATLHAAIDTPEQFTDLFGALLPGDGVCLSPIVDPVTLVHISLIRSLPGVGDYEVRPGLYGAIASELLRVDCRTGRAMGLVSR